MHASILSLFGISDEQSRNASLRHALPSSSCDSANVTWLPTAMNASSTAKNLRFIVVSSRNRRFIFRYAAKKQEANPTVAAAQRRGAESSGKASSSEQGTAG